MSVSCYVCTSFDKHNSELWTRSANDPISWANRERRKSEIDAKFFVFNKARQVAIMQSRFLNAKMSLEFIQLGSAKYKLPICYILQPHNIDWSALRSTYTTCLCLLAWCVLCALIHYTLCIVRCIWMELVDSWLWLHVMTSKMKNRKSFIYQ